MIIICVTAANPLQMRCDIYGDREQKSAGGRKANNRVNIANAPK